MNSYFPGMMKSEGVLERYMWCSNRRGEVVVWSVDKDLNEIGFSSSDSTELVRNLLESTGKYVAAKPVTPRMFFKYYGDGDPTWGNVLSVMNNPRASAERTFAENVHLAMYRLGLEIPIKEYGRKPRWRMEEK